MLKQLRIIFTVGLVVASALSFVGCDKIKKSVDCEQLCKHFKACYDFDLNVLKCRNRCYDTVDSSKRAEHNVSDCVECVKDRACTEAEERCSTCDEAYQTFLHDAGTDGDAGDEDAGTNGDAGDGDAGDEDAAE